MRVIAGRVVDGSIQVDAELEEGTAVAVLAAGHEGFRLSAEEQKELVLALESIRAGSYVDAEELLAEIRALPRR
jgi:DNA-binding NarL/FixJ family response regulator